MRGVIALALLVAIAGQAHARGFGFTGAAEDRRPAHAKPLHHDLRSQIPVDEQLPWFCHGLDCPRFKVVNTTDAYEVREYEKTVWVGTNVTTYAYALASSTGFKRLFDYIEGENDDHVKIPMTAPVVTLLDQSAQGPFCKGVYKVSFFVPFHKQDDPPRPSNTDIFVERYPAGPIYVSSFGGYVMDDYSIGKRVHALLDALEADGLSVGDAMVLFASYDPPFRLMHRHNEVWVILPNSTSSSRPAVDSQ